LSTRLQNRHREASRSGANEPGWATIGWQGVSLRAPEEFNPVAVSAEGEGGYLRIAGPDTRAIEIKWEEPKGVVSVPEALERYFAKLRKTARKARQEIRIRTRPKGLGALRPSNQAPITYAWEADRRAYGAIWHCGECRRLVIAEVVGGLEEDLSLAAPVLKSIEEHGRDGWNTWGMYGLAVQVPAEYRLEGHQLMSGYLRFAFRCRSRTLRVERWGLANVVLKGTSAPEWFLRREAERLSRCRFTREEVPWRGHAVCALRGRERLLPGAAHAVQAAASLSRPALNFHGYVWECPQTNKIFALTGHETGKTEVTRQVFERMECHG
jgi:hypothetical protein